MVISKREIRKDVKLSLTASQMLDELAALLKQERRTTCEQAIDYYLEHVRGGKPDKISVRLEKLLRIFNNRLEDLVR